MIIISIASEDLEVQFMELKRCDGVLSHYKGAFARAIHISIFMSRSALEFISKRLSLRKSEIIYTQYTSNTLKIHSNNTS